MSEPSLASLRTLRARARVLSGYLSADLKPFLHRKDRRSFVRLPTSDHMEGDLGVTVTCSCLMALVSSKRFDKFGQEIGEPSWKAEETFQQILSYGKWQSSKLPRM